MKTCFSCLEKFRKNSLYRDDDVYLKSTPVRQMKPKADAIRSFFDDSNIRYEVINTSDNLFSYQATVVDKRILSVQEFEMGISKEIEKILKKQNLVAQTCVTKESEHESVQVLVQIRVN